MLVVSGERGRPTPGRVASRRAAVIDTRPVPAAGRVSASGSSRGGDDLHPEPVGGGQQRAVLFSGRAWSAQGVDGEEAVELVALLVEVRQGACRAVPGGVRCTVGRDGGATASIVAVAVVSRSASAARCSGV
jgi:hypothetical protein